MPWGAQTSPSCTCAGSGQYTCGAFDLPAFNARNLRPQPPLKRQACLQGLLELFDRPTVSLSGPFEHGLARLHVAEQRGLEGVVSKRGGAP